MSWQEISLGDAIHIKHGFAFKSQYFAEEGKYVVLTPGNFYEQGGFKSRPGKDRFYQGDIPDEYVLDEGDVIVAMTEQGEGLLGSSAWIPESDVYLHNQRLGLVDEIDGSLLDRKFLYHLFNTRSVRQQIYGSATGTKVRHTAPVRIYRVKVIVPPVAQQRRIADIVDGYDSLIENNQRRIQLLEESARLLYKEWFVHLRFPGHEHVKVISGVPEGWRKKQISEVCDTIGGGTPKTGVGDYWDGDITWVVPSDITKSDSLALLDSERKITEKGLRESSAKMLPPETILMTSRASVGYFAIMDREVCTNQGFINIVPHDDIMRMYLLFNLMSRVEEVRANAKGTTYLEISKGRFRDMSVTIPTGMLLSEFGDYSRDVIQQVRTLKRTNAKLTRARDLLLPKLMSGELAA